MRVVFLDRDGVINQDRDDYVKNIHELKVFEFAPEAIRLLNEAGMKVIVVSNQQGVAKGIISDDDLQEMQQEITQRVESGGGKISGFYYCKHLATERCSCRKPQPGMLLKAARENDIDLETSIMVGDTVKDILAGKSAGCKTVLVLTGKLTREEAAALPRQPEYVADNLLDAAQYIVSFINHN